MVKKAIFGIIVAGMMGGCSGTGADKNPSTAPVVTETLRTVRHNSIAEGLSDAVKSGDIKLEIADDSPIPFVVDDKKANTRDILIAVNVKTKRNVNLLAVDGFKIQFGKFQLADIISVRFEQWYSSEKSPIDQTSRDTNLVNLPLLLNGRQAMEIDENRTYRLVVHVITSLSVNPESVQLIHDSGFKSGIATF